MSGRDNPEPLKKPDDPAADIRRQLCDLLPIAVQNAIASYSDFSQQTAPGDAKQFIAHHNACRAALAHLEALSKLGKWLLVHHPQTKTPDTLQPLLMEARRVLTQWGASSTDDDESEDDDDESGATEF